MGTALYLGGSVLAAIAASLALVFALSRPQLLVYPYLIPLFFFAMGGYGAEGASSDLWSRGSGVLPFPLVTWYLWGMGVVLLLAQQNSRTTREWPNISKPLLLFNILFIGHILAAITTGQSLRDTLSMNGLIGVVNLSIFFFILVFTFKTAPEIRRIGSLILGFAVVRGLYGMVRYVAFGGDPTNVYAQLEGLDVRLTFFDINDSAIAVLGATIAGWRLLDAQSRPKVVERLGYIAVVVLEVAIVVLSHRRSSWIGMLAAIVMFLICAPVGRRGAAAFYGLGGLAAGSAAIFYASQQRFATIGGGGLQGFIEAVLPDLGSLRSSMLSDRERELSYAWRTILDHPILGVGAWGRYEGQGIQWQTGDSAYAFLHSGFGQLALKSGVLGLALFLAALFGFYRFVWRVRAEISLELRATFYAGPVCMAFYLTTFVIGTPTIEIRTMQLVALALALPYIVHRVSRSAASSNA